MATTLYVVDMQPGFGASLNIVDETLKEIALAKKRNDIIAFVELAPSNNGNTLPQLMEAAKSNGYQKVLTTTKIGGDGSKEFIALMDSVKEPIKRVRVCGVNRNACVQNTVGGLVQHLPKGTRIEVACAATASGYIDKKWDPNGTSEKWYADLAAAGRIKLLLPSSSG